MADLVKQILSRPIQLADQVVKAGDEATINKQECAEIKSKTEKLAALIRQAARASSDLYERPARRIIDDTENVLEKALTMVQRCRDDGYIMRLFNIIPAAAFRKMISQLENSVGDVSWLLRVSTPAGNDHDEGFGYLGLPPIAANEPILGLIWEQIAVLMTGSPEDKSDAAASLASLARDNDRYAKLIVEEGGVNPLLKLVKEGKIDGQENAAKTIGLLGREPESVELMIQLGVCSVLANILKEGSMRVQAVVAWAVSELAGNHAKCQELFAQNNVIRLLVSHLAFETVQEHSKYAVVAGRATSMHHAVVMASKINLPAVNEEEDDTDETETRISNPLPNQMHNIVATTMAMKSVGSGSKSNLSSRIGTGENEKPTEKLPEKSCSLNSQMKIYSTAHQSRNASVTRGRELEDPVTKAYMKAMAARALWKLAVGNSSICRVITESRALLCFAVLLDKGDADTKYNTAMAIMEITAVAEENADLRRSAFRRTSSACKAVVEQLFRIVENADAGSDLLIPCVRSIGNLARTFKSAETHIIVPLVKLLDDGEPDLAAEVAITLAKFATEDNYLAEEHSRTIIEAGGSKHLVQLTYFGENGAQIPAMVLLSYIAMNVPDSEQLAKDEVLTVLEWASKQTNIIEDEDMEALLNEAKSRLELYQSRGSRGFHGSDGKTKAVEVASPGGGPLKKENNSRGNNGGRRGGGGGGCFTCGEVGHIAKDCSGGRGGGERRVGEEGCYKCGDVGHFARDCSQKSVVNIGAGKEGCYNCGNIGHFARDCMKKLAGVNGSERVERSSGACYTCHGFGHMARDCATKRQPSGSCYQCGGTGHLARDCVDRRGSCGEGGGNGKCFNCGKEGHFARECSVA